MTNKKIIKVKCDGTQYIDFHKLNEFQEDIKTITREDLDSLKSSIKIKGILMPGFVWKYRKKWWILDMHQRLKAFIELEKEGWNIPHVPVVEIFAKTKKEAKAAVLVFISQHGKVDEDKLKVYLKKYDIKLQNIVIRTEPMKIELAVQNKETKDDDEVPEKIKAISKLGDLWELGKHRVLCGDSLKDNGKLIITMANMLFTDPPYGVSYANKNTFLNTIDKGNCIQKEIKSDHLNAKDTQKFWYEYFMSIKKYLKKDYHSYYIFSPQINVMMMMMVEAKMPYKHVLIWVKNNHVLGRSDYNYKHEPMLYGWINRHKFYGKGEFKTSVWPVDKPHQNKLHPTMKPIRIIVNAILNSSLEGDSVIDSFLGSGSTLIACEKTNRICYGMELEPHYVDVSVIRWVEWMKKNNRPIKIKLNGKPFNLNRLSNG